MQPSKKFKEKGKKIHTKNPPKPNQKTQDHPTFTLENKSAPSSNQHIALMSLRQESNLSYQSLEKGKCTHNTGKTSTVDRSQPEAN